MTVTVSKATVVENIYKNFFDLVDAISGFSGKVWAEFPNNVYDNKSDYPAIITNSPNIAWEKFTFGKNVLEGNIEIDVMTTDAKTADQFTSDISNQIEISKDTLATLGLRNVNLTGTTKDVVVLGKIKVHTKTLTFEYKFYFTKTAAF